MPTIQMKMTEESYNELKELAQNTGESSVAALARTGLGLLHFLHRYVGQGYDILLAKDGSDSEPVRLLFPLKKGA